MSNDNDDVELHQREQQSFWRQTIVVGLITGIIPLFAVIVAECGASTRLKSQMSTSESGQSTRQAQQLDTAQAADFTEEYIRQSTEQAGYYTREANQATQEKRHLDDIVRYTATAEYRDTEIALVLNPPKPSITPHPTSDLTDPLQSIEAYYYFLNHGDYLAAWNLLHDQFKTTCCEKDFDAYKGYWSAAGFVSVVELEFEKQIDENNASVLVSLYFDKEGYERSYRYNMIFSHERSKWLIKSVSRI